MGSVRGGVGSRGGSEQPTKRRRLDDQVIDLTQD